MNESLLDDAALYALGLLEESRREEFEAAMRKDESLRAAVNDHAAVCAALALAPSAVEPPASLRAEVLALAKAMPLQAPAPAENVIRARFVQAIPWAIAAGFAIFAGGLAWQNLVLQKENVRLAREFDLNRLEVAVLAAASPEAAGASAQVVYNPATGEGVLRSTGLPEIRADQSYQVWVFEEDNPVPVPAGVFDAAAQARADFAPDRPVRRAVQFAVTIERQGGVPSPEGPVVLAGGI